jgi:hypothetical protein
MDELQIGTEVVHTDEFYTAISRFYSVVNRVRPHTSNTKFVTRIVLFRNVDFIRLIPSQTTD